MDPLPHVNKVFSFIIRDEKQRNVSSQVIGKTLDASIFAVKNGPPNSNKNYSLRNPHLKCDRCNLVGYTIANCGQHLKCDHYGYKGHTIDVCRKLKGIRKVPQTVFPKLIMWISNPTRLKELLPYIVSLLNNIMISLHSFLKQNLLVLPIKYQQ